MLLALLESDIIALKVRLLQADSQYVRVEGAPDFIAFLDAQHIFVKLNTSKLLVAEKDAFEVFGAVVPDEVVVEG